MKFNIAFWNTKWCFLVQYEGIDLVRSTTWADHPRICWFGPCRVLVYPTWPYWVRGFGQPTHSMLTRRWYTQKRFGAYSPGQQRLLTSFVDRIADHKFLFGWTTEATTRSIPPTVHVRCVKNYHCKLDNCFDGIITAYLSSLWTTQADAHTQHRTPSTWRNGSTEEHIFSVETMIWYAASDQLELTISEVNVLYNRFLDQDQNLATSALPVICTTLRAYLR